jgi:tetratricopeptide (TPR) repeat protein
LKWFLGLFSRYVNSFERRVDRFFRNIKSTDSSNEVRRELLLLMKEDLIVLNIWLEKAFKGYVYLNKTVRRQMYENVKKIVVKFEQNLKDSSVSLDIVKKELNEKNIEFPCGDEEKLLYISAIMHFLRPGIYYEYIKTASFGKLLRDPDKEKLEGDCNQIVTLYIYLYSLKFPIEDLSIKLLPEHVCLHFRNIDIEATNSSFQKYTESKEVLPVTEIISTNLLDLTDFREDVQFISERSMVKSAQLAYAVSSLKPLVAKNLNIAYRNLAISALNSKNYETAIFYLEKTDDREALFSAYKAACVYHMDNNNFSKALYYADKSGDLDLKKTVKFNEGIYYFKRNNFEKALVIFNSLGDEKMKKACYVGQYNELLKKVSGVNTVFDVKKNKSTYLKLLELAQKMGDASLEAGLRETLKHC